MLLVLVGLNAAVLVVLLLRSGGGRLEAALRDELKSAREESSRTARELREEVAAAQKSTTDSLVRTLGEMREGQAERLEQFGKGIGELNESNEKVISALRETVEVRLRELQESNEKRLEKMRETVDEKLQSTLEKRIGESFKQVSDQLEKVYKGIGEMQTLADGVGDLKRVLTNVKTRGTFGEIQLGAILEQILTREQYGVNVATRPDSAERVEFAVRLPGPEDDPERCVWLPIDSKFPQEDYLRLVDAAERGDQGGVQQATAALKRTVVSSAKEICDKYVAPPHTTDFALMFLPTEGLYAEILRQPGLVEDLQRNFRVVPAGPTTLSAVLSSLRMGFRTLALEKRSSEVWRILSAVKTEFGKFGDVMEKLKRQLSAASNTIEETSRRTRVMSRKLREVEALPGDESSRLLEISAAEEGTGVEDTPGDEDDEP